MKKLITILFLLPLFTFAQTINISENLSVINGENLSQDFNNDDFGKLTVLGNYGTNTTKLDLDTVNLTLDFTQIMYSSLTTPDTVNLYLTITNINYLEDGCVTYAFTDYFSNRVGFLYVQNDLLVFALEGSYLTETGREKEFTGFMGFKE